MIATVPPRRTIARYLPWILGEALIIVATVVAQVEGWFDAKAVEFLPLALYYFIGIFLIISIARFVVLLRNPPPIMSAEAAARNDDALYAPLADQPDLALALSPGQTITLTRRKAPTAWFIESASAYIFLVYCGRSALDIIFPTSTSATSLDYVMLAFGVVSIPTFLYIAINQSLVRITINDAGITIRGRLRKQHIAWQDIKGIVRLRVANGSGYPIQSYKLLKAKSSVSLKFSQYPISTQAKQVKERFEGGVAQYAYMIDIALATLCVRTGQPIRKAPAQAVRAQPQLLPLHYIAAEACELPIVSEQPGPFFPDSDFSASGKLTLRAALPWVGIILGAIGISVGLFVVSYGMLLIAEMQHWLSSPYYFDKLSLAKALIQRDWQTGLIMAFIITIAIICIFTVIILVAMFKALRKQIIFDATGVNTRLRHITWQHVRAFVVYQHPRQPKRLMYLLYTDLDTYPFAWYEDTRFRLSGRCGNRRQAYRDRAALVHAYIAQQTGLPLRQLKAR